MSVTQVLLMASPLSGLLRAVRQRSSAKFHLGVCAMGLLSSSLWAIYAMVSPPAPPARTGRLNRVGACSSTASLAMCLLSSSLGAIYAMLRSASLLVVQSHAERKHLRIGLAALQNCCPMWPCLSWAL